MMRGNAQWAGYAGVIIIQLSYLPQIYRVWHTRSVQDLSPWFFLVIALGVALLEVYSIAIKDKIYIISNAWALLNISVLLALIWHFG